MRVLMLCRHDRSNASSRHRSLQYIPFLRDCGIEAVPAPLLTEPYLRRRFSGARRPSFEFVLRAYLRRFATLLSSGSFDLIWIEQEALPWIPGPIESVLMPSKIPYVVDYDDAWFHRYDLHHQQVIRALLGSKIDRVMREATLVIAGNKYVSDHARTAGARWVEILPTVVDLERYPLAPSVRHEPFTVGWIGTPMTAAQYLELAHPVLRDFCRDGKSQFLVIGAGDLPWRDVPVEHAPWSEGTEVELLRRMDVGIMPLIDAPWERGKCGFKLVQYMAVANPVIASPVGANLDIIRDGENGFLASTHQEWIAALQLLRNERDLATKMGMCSRRIVEERFSLQGTAPRLAHFMSIAATLAKRGEQQPARRN